MINRIYSIKIDELYKMSLKKNMISSKIIAGSPRFRVFLFILRISFFREKSFRQKCVTAVYISEIKRYKINEKFISRPTWLLGIIS